MPAPQVFSTERPIALVTGGSRGLGKATVLALAHKGIDAVLTYKSAKAEADAVVAEVAGLGRKAVALQFDVLDFAHYDDFIVSVRQALQGLGAEHLTALVNNAGTSHHKLIADTTETDLDALYGVHFKAPFLLTQKLLPVLADGSRIVNISSGLARIIMPGSAPYGAMKGAIEVLTQYMAKEFGARGIAVNTVAPGATETDFSGGRVRDNAELNQQIASTVALGRVGVPEDIGPMIASLLTEDNRWINAQRIEVSGGQAI
jgi:NAD(P)-dependent dehydrogenase (short-subunit alcohol dehydrogenase family)